MNTSLENSAVVMITYNSAQIVSNALSNVTGNKVYVLDNASTDCSRDIILEKFPWVKLLTQGINIGFGRGANSAFNEISKPYALLLNPDVDVDPKHLSSLEKLASQAGDNWLYIAPNSGHVVTEIDEPAPEGLKSITHATGCALLFNLENFLKLGGFDENIFLYYEEMDLSSRAHQAGMKMYYAEDIHVTHHSKQSSAPSQALDDLRNWHFQWSSLYYKRKHGLWKAYAASLFEYLALGWAKKLFAPPEKKRKVSMKVQATLAHLKGQPAFNVNGTPFIPD